MEKTKISRAGNKGFTLLELIIVLLIVGLSAAIAIVMVSRSLEKKTFNETTQKVFVTLKHAREIALMEKMPVTFKVGEENNSYWIEKSDLIYGRPQNMPENISISGEPIIFFPKGNSSGGHITIKDAQGRRYSIEVDPVLGTPKAKRI